MLNSRDVKILIEFQQNGLKYVSSFDLKEMGDENHFGTELDAIVQDSSEESNSKVHIVVRKTFTSILE